MLSDTGLDSPQLQDDVLDDSFERQLQPGIEIKNLRININKREVLRHINVVFPRNSISAIIGPTGCGKTTLLRALNRLHDDDPNIEVTGGVYLDGADIYQASNLREVRRRIGMLFQRPNPFPQSILENLSIGPRSHGLVPRGKLRGMAEERLRAVGLWDAVATRLNSSPYVLSGGQQQLLCLARALTVNPSVLLLDEPTSSLDPNTTLLVEGLVRDLASQVTVVMVTHNLQQAKRLADQVLFLMSGNKIEYAPNKQFFSQPADPRTRGYIAEVLG